MIMMKFAQHYIFYGKVDVEALMIDRPGLLTF